MAYLATYGGPRSEQSRASVDGSLWAPLRQTLFLGLFLAAFASNVGTWIQNVAAAWLMTSLAPNALMVGLVQALSGLPVFLFIIPAGALADLIDRRRLLLFAEGWMLVTAALLGVLTVAGLVTPWLLLLLTFVLGIGAALNNPAFQASLPEWFALEPAALMPAPMIGNINSDVGPVMVSIEYEINPAQAEEFRQAMQALRTIRFRDGAVFWGLFSDAAKAARYVEYFMVESWFEHQRQHGRVTEEDSPAFERARQFHLGPTPPTVSHQLAVRRTWRGSWAGTSDFSARMGRSANVGSYWTFCRAMI